MFARLFPLLALALVFSPITNAQTTYRWIDKATGQTVFSDQPPPPNAAKVVAINEGGSTGDSSQLPYATRQAAAKFPVILYTSANCVEECKQARQLLNGRGIPFSEKMLKNDQDSAELAKILGEAIIPSLSVGSQNFKGLESGAWNNLLDLAGYPKSAPYGSKPSGIFAQ